MKTKIDELNPETREAVYRFLMRIDGEMANETDHLLRSGAVDLNNVPLNALFATALRNRADCYCSENDRTAKNLRRI